LAGEEGFTMLELSAQTPGMRLEEVATYIALRTRFFDDAALAAAGEGVHQGAILAAGMGARALRVPWPAGTAVFELDRPELLELKGELLGRHGAEPACRRVPVGVDLTGPWVPELLAAGFAPEQPSFWLAEGFFYYLEEASVRDLLARV